MAPVYDVAIVGAGLLGLAAARSLAARGRDFVVLEQAAVGHEGAGSKGSCRIFRLGYADPGYVTAARRALERWRELEAQAGRPILVPAPHITFGPDLAAVQAAMTAAGAPCELLSADAVADQFPAVTVGGPALLETQSAVIAAAEALTALAELAGLSPQAGPDSAGTRLRTGVRVTGVADDGSQVRLQTSDGVVTARVAIIAAGPWTAGLLAGQLALPTTPTLEQVAYLEPRGPADPAPIFICHGGEAPYGLPVPGSGRYKIGIHPSGGPVSPDSQDQSPDLALVARLTAVAERYLPGYRPEPAATERCVYDNTADEDFILDRVGNVVVGCGTSGHGFKFGPLLGEWLAELATGGPSALAEDGSAAWARARFSAARFSAAQVRAAAVRASPAPGTR
jgi:sarcosine oxidase